MSAVVIAICSMVMAVDMWLCIWCGRAESGACRCMQRYVQCAVRAIVCGVDVGW